MYKRQDLYRSRLQKACEYLSSTYPKAQLIFATTTAVPEGAAGRFPGDSVKYNEVALDVLKDYPSIAINDLYAFTMTNAEEWYIKPGDVHYNDSGMMAQGKHVASIIQKNL